MCELGLGWKGEEEGMERDGDLLRAAGEVGAHVHDGGPLLRAREGRHGRHDGGEGARGVAFEPLAGVAAADGASEGRHSGTQLVSRYGRLGLVLCGEMVHTVRSSRSGRADWPAASAAERRIPRARRRALVGQWRLRLSWLERMSMLRWPLWPACHRPAARYT